MNERLKSDIPPLDAKVTPRVAIFIVAYNAASTLRKVLDRIPESVWDMVAEVFVFDDSSTDDTYLVGLGYKELHGKAKLSVFRNKKNLGYGGNQIRGYQYAIEQGYDIVALLHGDGQYAPEALPELLAPLIRGEADAVFGSRMMKRGDALKGGMPLYKYVGNRILTTVENAALGMNLSEFHSGYRLYSLAALKEIPFDQNTQDFHFDTQIIIQLNAAGKRIVEVPIPTYYGDEICHVNGMKYAKDVVKSVFDFRLHELGLKTQARYAIKPQYKMKRSPFASHSQILRIIGTQSRGSGGKTILDVGSGQGELGAALRERGHYVVGIDQDPPKFELDEFIQGNLEENVGLDPNRQFDIIVLADVLEHVADPEKLLLDCKRRLVEHGRLIVSIPNVVHWSVRMNVLLGKFEYTNRGIMDRGHLRFFTRESADELFRQAGLEVVERCTTPVPWENVLPGLEESGVPGALERLDRSCGTAMPNLFAYQHIVELKATGSAAA